MRSKFVLVAACLMCFGSGTCLDAFADDSGKKTSSSQKSKKRTGKKSAKPAATDAAAAAAGAAATGAAAATPADPAKTGAQTPPGAAPANAEGEGKVVKTDLYTVVDGFKVDKFTMDGFRTWRSAACDRCHGANQEGMVGPSLIDSLKKLTKDEFKTAVLDGRLEKGMPSFNASERVVKYIDNLYVYLKGRSDGAIVKAKTMEMD